MSGRQFRLVLRQPMPISKYHSIPLIGSKSFTTEESNIEVAFLRFKITGNFSNFVR